MNRANKIFFFLTTVDIVLFSLFIGVGKGTHQFSKVIFPVRYAIESMKNDYKRTVSELEYQLNKPRPTSLPRPSITPAPTALPTKAPKPKIIYKAPVYTYPTTRPYTPPTYPTTDWSWIESKKAENQKWFAEQSAKNQQQSDNWYKEQVQKQQQDLEAWKKANGF